MNKYMKAAYDEALKNIDGNEGGPFGAVIVKEGEIIASAHNQVLVTNDPTMHAEIIAIRTASEKLGRFILDDCEIYTTCEPCPMCLAAIMWARISKVYFGANRMDAEAVGFDDNNIYEYIKGTAGQDMLSLQVLDQTECVDLFNKWREKRDKKMY